MGKKQQIHVKFMFHCSLITFFLGGLAIVAFYKNGGERRPEISVHRKTQESYDPVPDSLDGCDLFSGQWVYDNKSYPLYKENECTFMFGDLACTQFGRKDSKYQHWRWQPHGCVLPRFDAKAVLERLRDKRVVFVGDSVNRNQWVSMVCMLESSIPLGFKAISLKGLNASLYSFKATEYNATIDYYWAPMLVESNADNPSKHHIDDRTVRIKSIEKHARNWANADILIFNSYLWWTTPTMKVLHGSFEDSNKVYEKVDAHLCYKMALETWSNWLAAYTDSKKTELFFMSMTATHRRGHDWGKDRGQNCLNETKPVTEDGFWESGSDPRMMRILESSLSNLKARGLNVQMINITEMTQYRKDGHPSIYRKQWVPLKKKQLANPLTYADCTHWCLPGVPDVWNEILSIYLLRRL